MNTNYCRVIPRDLFNESKLLKCIGRLILLIHDGFGLNIRFDFDGEPFIISLQDDHTLAIYNIDFYFGEEYLNFYTTYNSKMNYPLYCYLYDQDILVFDEEGNFTEEFKNIINTKTNEK